MTLGVTESGLAEQVVQRQVGLQHRRRLGHGADGVGNEPIMGPGLVEQGMGFRRGGLVGVDLVAVFHIVLHSGI